MSQGLCRLSTTGWVTSIEVAPTKHTGDSLRFVVCVPRNGDRNDVMRFRCQAFGRVAKFKAEPNQYVFIDGSLDEKPLGFVVTLTTVQALTAPPDSLPPQQSGREGWDDLFI